MTPPIILRRVVFALAVAFAGGAVWGMAVDARERVQGPARDAATRVATVGTASLTGTVVVDDGRQTPARRATVTLNRAGTGDSWVLATDEQGRYAFTDLPAATYSLAASKGAFLPAVYGATKVGGQPVPISLKDGQQFTATPLVMVRGGVLTGRVVDVNGRPMASTTVRISTVQVMDGERRLANSFIAGNGVTDARGIYRLYGLPPGDYVLAAMPRDTTTAMTMTLAEQQWAQQHQGVAPSPGAVALPPPSRPFTAAATYFPNTADLSAAAIITLGKSEERSGVDVTVVRVGVARVSGTVVDVDGQPVNGAILVRSSKQPSQPNPLALLSFSAQSRTSADGAFVMSGVTPGAYTVVARAAAGRTAAPAPGAAPASPFAGLPSGPMTLWGQADVMVNGDDVEGVAIRLQPAMTVSGSIAFEGTAPVPTDLGRFQPRLIAPQRSVSVEVNGGTPPVPSAADRTFKIEGVVPGTYRLSGYGSGPVASSQPANTWWIKSATRDGKDLLDTPFEIRAGEDLPNVVVTYTDRHTELDGTLVDKAGQPVARYILLAFSTNRSRWDPDSVARWTATARAGSDGTFKFVGLPPGEYYVCALTELDQSQRPDAAFFESLVSASYKVTLAEGEKKAQTFRVGG